MVTTFPPGTPSWVDLGSTDVPGAAAFYGTLFGWTVEDLGPESGGYGMIRKDGKLVGGIGPATDPDRGTSWSVYFATADVDSAAAKVEAHGGKVVMAPMDAMDQGRMAVCQDPAGAYFSLWQPGRHQGAEIVGAPGSMSWAELMSTDVATAKTFYESVLGVTTHDIDVGRVYTLLRVGEKDVAGAMSIGPEHGPMPSRWSVYFTVEDRDATADTALELGAREVARTDSPAGELAFLTDPQGGAFCVIKPDPSFSA